MLELIDLDRTISKAEYKQVYGQLEIDLGACQRAALEAGVPVVVVFEGWDAAGKGTLINRLTQALDPRGFKVHPISAPTETERLRPWLARFATTLPPAGKIAIFDRSWYGRVLIERMEKMLPKREWQRGYGDIEEFERRLADAGTVIVKFWLHIGRAEQRRRFRKIEKTDATAWKVGKDEWRQNRRYAKWMEAVEETLERTSTSYAPWTIVEATQGRFARVKAAETLVTAIQTELARRAEHPRPKPKPMPEPKPSATRRRTILDRVDLSLALERDDYEERLDALQEKLFHLEHDLYAARIPAVIAYEGADAGGKGGNIRRLTRGLDPRGYEVVP
ncbi:phosphate--AMP phosphotransferase, partial [bacterium]|nr:phosphate--AMP phosphotransferase [bacterium]